MCMAAPINKLLMRLRLRLLLLVLASFWNKPLGIMDESLINFTVLPNDIDIALRKS